MPYLSKVALNPRRRSALALLSNPHRLHAAVLGGLAAQPVAERVLWRLETNTAHRAQILVLTNSRPSWEHLVEPAGWPGVDGGGHLIADYTPLLQRVVLSREFAFRLTANPVQTRPAHPSGAAASASLTASWNSRSAGCSSRPTATASPSRPPPPPSPPPASASTKPCPGARRRSDRPRHPALPQAHGRAPRHRLHRHLPRSAARHRPRRSA